jgi:O-antigen ligase
LHPHNGILEVWVELGAIGALGLAAFIWKIMAGIMRRINDRATAAVFSGAAVSYMVIGLAAYSVWSSWWIAAGVLAAASGTAFLAERELTGGRGSQQIRQGIGN